MGWQHWWRIVGAALLVLIPGAARAVTVRRFFEPTDLEFEVPGMAELDMAYGLVRGQDAYRVSAPDFEFDLGLTSEIELDLDGEFAIGGPDDGELRIDQLAQDNLWTAIKYGIATYEDKEDLRAFALGLQVGPIIPIAPGAQGVGIEGLLLGGMRQGDDFYAINLGGFTEPGDGTGDPRATGVAAGLDAEIALDHDGTWSILGEIGGVAYASPDAPQFTTTLGLQWSPTDTLDLSIVGLRGWLPGGDQWAVLLGVSPKFALW